MWQRHPLPHNDDCAPMPYSHPFMHYESAAAALPGVDYVAGVDVREPPPGRASLQ